MITDQNRDDALERYYERGILKREVRSYEVSLWTLLDEFITVLKWSDVEQKGRIEEPSMTLNIDGTQNFSFKIPMYLNVWDETTLSLKLKENPIWYNAQGNLIEGLRKVRVIFNKGSVGAQRVFDFIIIKVTETHEGDVATCQVDCEGLAFHELGKIGYKISLSLANFELVYAAWKDGGMLGELPIQNLLYWCKEAGLEPYDTNKPINARTWYYKVQMDWSSFAYSESIGRSSDVVYEEAYVASWNDLLIPQSMLRYKEKARPVEIDKSNLYNITQTIAEKFGVHCRYDYTYDDNYQITERVVVFYNNFNRELEGLLSFTYPYSAKSVERNIDTTDLTTKMFIETVEGVNDILDTVSIMDSEANMMKEDYLLNFDYLHTINGVTDEQYEEVTTFLKNVREINVELLPLLRKLAAFERKKTEVEAKKTVSENSKKLAQEQIDYNLSLLNSLLTRDAGKTEPDGFIHITAANPDIIYVTGTGKKGYMDLLNTNKGIEPGSVHVYQSWNPGDSTCSGEINKWKPVYDDTYGYIIRLNNVPIPLKDKNSDTEPDHRYYVTYKYTPKLYYEPIIKTWQIKIALDDKAITEYTALVTKLEEYIADAKENIDRLLTNKAALLKEFERMMGPALREGYWTPEDYLNYGEDRVGYGTLSESYTTINKNNKAYTVFTVRSTDDFVIGWDSELFDEEERNEYEVGVTLTKAYYPCINLEHISFSNETERAHFWQNIDKYSVVFNTNYYDAEAGDSSIKYSKIYAIGSEAILRFMTMGGGVIPVLILIGAKNLSNYVQSGAGDSTTPVPEIDFMKNPAQGNPRLAIVDTSNLLNAEDDSNFNLTEQGGILTHITKIYDGNDNEHGDDWIPDGSPSYKMIYPRIKFNTTNVRGDATNLTITYKGIKLEPYEDYQITTRITEYAVASELEPDELLEYYINIKPEAIVTKYETRYDPDSPNTVLSLSECLLNNEVGIAYKVADLATGIYVDGLEIAKKSSEPKVEYNLEASIIDDTMLRTLYNNMARIVMINDVELKLDQVFGYISGMTLNLDHPESDTIEIKNYTDKFEDLFSTIVAQTTQISRESGNLASALDGNTGLSAVGLDATLSKYGDLLDLYLDTHFKTSSTVETILKGIFDEAGLILGSAQNALGTTVSLTLENSSILSGFAKRVAEDLSPVVTRSTERPVNFKTGDVWIELDSSGKEIARYVATMDDGNTSSSGGFTRTHDGTLAAITGAKLSIDAEAGSLSLTASDHIYIAAGSTVDIVGNKEVNIGGTTINIGTTSINGSTITGGVNIVATSYNDLNFVNALTSKVLIHPNEIYMAGAKITMLAGTGANNTSTTTSIVIDGTTGSNASAYGIWLGTGKSIGIFSENITNHTATTVDISPIHIFFGVTNTANSNTTAVEFTENYLLFAAGTAVTDLKTNDILVNNDLTGVKITKDKIGLAASKNGSRSAIIMDGTGIIVGTGTINTSNYTGSYTSITKAGIVIGGTGIFRVNTTNFKVLPEASGTDPLFYVGDDSTISTENGTSETKYIKYSINNGLEVMGELNTTKLKIKIGDDGARDIFAEFYTRKTDNNTTKETILGNIISFHDSQYNREGLAIGGKLTSTGKLYSSIAFDNTNKNLELSAIENILLNPGNSGLIWAYKRMNFQEQTYFKAKAIFSSTPYIYDTNSINSSTIGEGFSIKSRISFNAKVTKVSWKNNHTIDAFTLTLEMIVRLNTESTNGNTYTFPESEKNTNDPTVSQAYHFIIGTYTYPKSDDDDSDGQGSSTYKGKTGTTTEKEEDGGDVPKTYGGCFVKGTLVKLADNTTIKIENIKPGMMVKSYDEKTRKFITAKVDNVTKYKALKGIYDIYLSSGKVLTLTGGHPILTTEGWAALDVITAFKEHPEMREFNILDINNEVVSFGEPQFITNIIPREDLNNSIVYNIDVKPSHTYIVENVVVHNTMAELK